MPDEIVGRFEISNRVASGRFVRLDVENRVTKLYDRKVYLSGSVRGLNGKSAYQIAVENGFVGTEAEFAASLLSGAASYSETFTASTSWTVDHPLAGFRPSVMVVDSTGAVVLPGSIDYVSATRIVVTHGRPTAGSVYLS